MYKILIQKIDDRCVRQVMHVSAETLVEAERYVLSVLAEQYITHNILLQYTDDLIYTVIVDGYIAGTIKIELEG